MDAGHQEPTYPILVIGGGPAGVTAALRARELGAGVALVECSRLGGTCTNDGCVPTRFLAKAARVVRDARQFAPCGVSLSAQGVDFAGLLGLARQTVERMHAKKRLAAHLAEAGVTVMEQAGPAHFCDPHTIELQDGQRLHGEKIILCAGGHTRPFSFPGCEHAITYQQVGSLERLPRSAAILGSSSTACQLGSILAALGAEVHLLDTHASLLGMEDELISRAVSHGFRKRGIHIRTGIRQVDAIEPLEGGLRLHYTHGEQPRSLDVEAVVWALGWEASAEHLDLHAAGVQRNQRGFVVVNDYMQTSAAHIFAAGDITGRMMLVQSGAYEGRIAAENAVLGLGQPYRHRIVPHGGFTDPEYAGVGLTEEQARQGQAIRVAVVPYADSDRAVIDGRTEGACKLIVSEETHRILGAHIVGEQALEIVQLVAAGMAADMWVEQLAELEIAYPTYTAVVGLAARRIMHEMGVYPLTPQWRSTGQPPPSEWERSTSTYDIP